MSKLLLLVTIFACIYASQGMIKSETSTCSTHGITHFRGFSTTDYVEPCYQIGTKVLFQNQWAKVSLHTYLNESTLDYDWMSSKVFIEIFGDLPDVPIALISSDMILCNCTTNCIGREGKLKMGVDGAVDVNLKIDADSPVLYIYYRRANIAMYLRKGIMTWNFGINVPSDMLHSSSGMCVSSCPRLSEHETYDCLKGSKLVQLADVCRTLFADIKQNSFVDIAIIACSHDMVLWKDVTASLDNRFIYIDELMIKDYDTIDSRYIVSTVTRYDLLDKQQLVDSIKCDSSSKTMINHDH